MAKTYHVIRPADCSVETIQASLNTVASQGGVVISVVAHAAPVPDAGGQRGVTHDNRWCVIDIFYSKG